MVQPWNLGPGLMDFSPIGNLGKTFQQAADAATKRDLDAQRRQTFAALGQGDVDYATVGRKLIGLGEVEQGAALIGLGQKAEDRRLELDAYRNSPFSGATRAAPSSTAPVAGPASLIQNESGGNWQAQNDATGAGGMKGHFGRLQFGQARLQEAQAAGVIPAGTTPQQFMASPELQKRAEQWHFNDIDSFISQNGLDRVVGRQINGVPVTVDGMRAVAHLGGKQGLAKFIVSGGKYNPADENGTRLSDYLARHGGGGGTAPVQAATAPRPVQVAETEEDVQRLEAQQSGALPMGGGTYAQSSTEELNAFLQSPRVPENLKTMMRQELASREAGQAPVQVAQAAPAPGSPVSDVPAAGAAPAQGFVVPPGGSALPPNDPYPQVSNQQLVEVIRNPRSPAGDKTLAQQIFASRQAYTAENAPDKRALARAQAEKADLEARKLRRELEGEGARPMTPEERAAYSVPEGQPAYMNNKGEPRFGPASTKITNSIGATEGEYAKANGKAISERFSKIVEEGDAASMEAGALAQLRNLGGQIKNMGTGAALQAKLAEYGIKVGENVSEIEAYSALIDKLTPQQRIAGAGATSDFDAKMFKNSLPGLIRTPQGNALILDTLDALNAYKRQRADVVAEAMANNEKPADVLKKLRELPDPFASFKEARKGAGPGAPAAPAAEPGKADNAEGGWQDLGGGVRIREKR